MANLLGSLRGAQGAEGPVVPIRDLADVKHDEDLNDGDTLVYHEADGTWHYDPAMTWNGLPNQARARLSLTDVKDVDRDTAPHDGEVLRWNAAEEEWKFAAPTAAPFPVVIRNAAACKTMEANFTQTTKAKADMLTRGSGPGGVPFGWRQWGSFVTVALYVSRTGSDLAPITSGLAKDRVVIGTLDDAIPAPVFDAPCEVTYVAATPPGAIIRLARASMALELIYLPVAWKINDSIAFMCRYLTDKNVPTQTA